MIINSTGKTVPPAFFFQRARHHDSLIFGVPPGSLGLVNSPQNSKMTGPLSFRVLEHVKKHTRTFKEDNIVLTMDNHKSHFTLASILYAKENGITFITFPLYCSY
jgi:hypothetical protein